MNQVEVAVIGTGWCGGIRAETLSRSALVDKLHICEIRPDRLVEVKALTSPATRDARLPGHRQEPEHFGGLCLHHAGAEPLPDHARLPQSRQARAVGKADRHGAVGGGRADHARQARPAQIHHRLFAAVQSQIRLRQEEDHRRHAGQGGLGDGEPPFEPRAGHQDRQAGEAVAGGDGVHPRSRLRVLAARARQARARLFAGRLRLHAADQRLLRRHVVDRHHGQRHAW